MSAASFRYCGGGGGFRASALLTSSSFSRLYWRRRFKLGKDMLLLLVYSLLYVISIPSSKGKEIFPFTTALIPTPSHFIDFFLVPFVTTLSCVRLRIENGINAFSIHFMSFSLFSVSYPGVLVQLMCGFVVFSLPWNIKNLFLLIQFEEIMRKMKMPYEKMNYRLDSTHTTQIMNTQKSIDFEVKFLKFQKIIIIPSVTQKDRKSKWML